MEVCEARSPLPSSPLGRNPFPAKAAQKMAARGSDGNWPHACLN